MIDMKGKRIIVVGDVMLDRYWQGATERISPEAPVPVVRVQDTRACPGGGGNVALNLAALDIPVSLFGLVGKDSIACELRSALNTHKISLHLLAISGLKTITKLRIFSCHQQLIRLDQENDFSAVDVSELFDKILQSLDEAALVILSDYNKGTLANICPDIINRCRQLSVPVMVDPKGHNWQRYQNATVLTPNMSEFQQIVGDCSNDKAITDRGRELIANFNLTALLITRSEKGMTLITTEQVINIPAYSREVFDVTGAGDTVIAVFSAACASGKSLQAAAVLANQAAGIVVGKLGAATITQNELADFPLLSSSKSKIFDEQDLLIELKTKHSGKQVVMTNGCFDILHAGHVTNLEQCKALGDILIVAVNDDVSIQQLKGRQRPVIPLQQRLQILAGLSSVDYLVAFSEQTPERLIQAILPDVLAKGNDYHVDQVIGAEAVISAGGRVELTESPEVYSSTEIIKRIRNLPD